MTARVNQDALERFFGMMRSACGSNDHPDAKVFLQVYRLVGTYSLVKPPRGSNISGGEMLKSLTDKNNLKDTVSKSHSLRAMLDSVLDRGTDIHIFADSIDDPDHNYYMVRSGDYCVAYMAGYVARKARRFTKCEECMEYLTEESSTDSYNILIDIKSKGCLLKPSKGLFQLIQLIEECTLRVVTTRTISIDTLGDVVHEMDIQDYIPLVGCLSHQHDFTYCIMRFYLITRMHFLSNSVNKIDAVKAKNTKKHRKLAKL